MSVPAVVQEVLVVQQPQRVYAGQCAVASLLPVNPPEIHPHLLIGMVQILKICIHKRGVRGVKGDLFPAFRVNPHGAGHLRIGLFMTGNAFRWMQVQCYMEPPVMQFFQKPSGVREIVRVPGVAGPAAAAASGDIGQMPVHVDHRRGEGNLLLPEPVHQLQIGLLRIGVIPAPPVAQGIAGYQRSRAGKTVKILQAAQIVVAVAEKVQIRFLCFPGMKGAVRRKNRAVGIIQNREAVLRHQAPLQLHRAVGLIQGPGRSTQVPDFVPKAPQRTVNAEALGKPDLQALR